MVTSPYGWKFFEWDGKTQTNKLFSRTTGPILTKLGTKYRWMKGIQVCSKKGPRLLPRGDNYEIAKIHWRNLKNHTSNFNQTWHKVFLGEGDTSFVKWSMPISKETSKWDSENTLTKFKNLLLQNHPATFNQSFWKLPYVKDPQGFTNKDHSILKMRYLLIFSYSSTLWNNHSIAQMCF